MNRAFHTLTDVASHGEPASNDANLERLSDRYATGIESHDGPTEKSFHSMLTWRMGSLPSLYPVLLGAAATGLPDISGARTLSRICETVQRPCQPYENLARHCCIRPRNLITSQDLRSDFEDSY